MAGAFSYLFVRRLLGADGTAGMETRPTVDAVRTGTRPAMRLPRAVGALISALSFAFGGYLAGYPSQQLAILETQVWLPLILLSLDVGLVERRWRHVLAAGLAWGVALLAGHPQSAMYLFYGALLYALYRSWQSCLDWRRALMAQAAWAGIGLGIAAVHLLPAYEFMRLSVRSSLTYAELAGGFDFRDFYQFLVPGAFTHWSPVYVGILPLFLAVMACLIAWKRREQSTVAFWLALALLCLILSLGGKGVLYRLIYWVVPGFRLFRSQERAIYLTSLSLSVLAGYGWYWIHADREHAAIARWGSRALLALSVCSLLAILVVMVARSTIGPEANAWLRRLALLASLAGASWAIVRWGAVWPMWGTLTSLGLVVLDLGVVTMPINLAPGPAESRVYDGSWLGAVIEDEGLYRIANEWGLPGNVGCWLRRQDLYGASPLRLSAHRAMSDALPHWRLWQLLDVRYVATWEHDLPGPYAWRRIGMEGEEWAKDTVYAYALEPDFPRAWVVHRARAVQDRDALVLLADPAFDPWAEVLVPASAPDGYVSEGPPHPSQVEIVRYAPERIVVHAEVSAPGWLVLGEWDYPGWRALVDGERRTIYRADYGLRAVPLMEGQHEIEFRYRPASVYVGAAISVVVLVVTVVLMLVMGRRQEESVGVGREPKARRDRMPLE
jgi:hypothetical protein